MSAQPQQQIRPLGDELGSFYRWADFADRFKGCIRRLEKTGLQHKRIVVGTGEYAYVACSHPMHGSSGRLTEKQPWPCPELLRVAKALGIDITSSIEAQRQIDVEVYGPALEPSERSKRWFESLSEGDRNNLQYHRDLASIVG